MDSNIVTFAFTTTLHQSNEALAAPPIGSLKLCNAISLSSSSFPSTVNLLLEESLFDIVTIAQKCIRSAVKNCNGDNGSDNGNDSDKNKEQSLHMLKVSIHCLRAVSSHILSKKKKLLNGKEWKNMGMVIKLLYHAISTVESLQKILGLSLSVEFLDSSLVCLHGYQVLGMLLSFVMEGHGGFLDSNSKSSGAGRDSLFNVPCLEMGTSRDGLEEFGGLTLTLLIKIVTQSHLFVANLMNVISKVFAMRCIGGIGMEKEEENENDAHIGMLTSSMQSLFGFGGDAGGYSYDPPVNEDKMDALSSCLGYYKNLISWFVMPWTLLPIAMDGSQVDSGKIQSAFAVVSKISKGLLDTASFLEKSCANCKEQKMITELQQHSLGLQQKSILLYLKNFQGCWIALDSGVLSGINYASLISKSFEKVCTLALRASVTYSMTKNVDMTVLTKFHCQVGIAIDQTAYLHKLLDSDSQSQYVDYSVFRSMHFANDSKNAGLWRRTDECKSNECILAAFPFPFRHRIESCREKDVVVAIMAVFYLGLSAKYSIQSSSNSKNVVDSVIDSFRSGVLEGDCTKRLMLAYQTLSKLELQLLAVKQMKPIDKRATVDNWGTMYDTARILGECSGPLSLKMMKSVKKDRGKYYSHALDCYLRAAKLLDELNGRTNNASLGEETYQYDCLQESDRLIECCRELSLCIPDKEYIPIVNSVAKSISNIAKRRMTKELTKESILPFFASLEIFLAINDKDLPSRFLQVSTVLQSEDMLKEAFVVLCYSISYLAKQSCKDEVVGRPAFYNILLFCDDYINGTMPSEAFVQSDVLSDVMIQTLSRLGRLSISIIRGGGKVSPLDESYQSPLLVKIRQLAKLSPLDLLRYFVQATIAPGDCSSFSLDEAEFRMTMALEFLQCFGGDFSVLVRRQEADLDLSRLVECIRTFVDEVKLSFHNSEMMNGGPIASLRIVGAATVRSLSKYNNDMEEDEYYRDFVEVAVNELQDTLQLEISDKRSAQIIIAQTSVLLLSDYEDKCILDLCKAALDMAGRSKGFWIESGLRNYNNALLLNLFKVLQTLEYTGSSVAAAEYIPLLEKAAQISIQGKIQLETIITPLLARGELCSLAKGQEASINYGSEQSTNQMINQVEDLFERIHETSNFGGKDVSNEEVMNLVVELQTSSAVIQSIMLTEDKDRLPSLVASLSNSWTRRKRDYLGSGVNADLPTPLLLPVAWWSSSCFMALFSGNMRLGDISSARFFIRLCCDITQNAFTILKTVRKQTSPIASVYADNFLESYLCSKGYEKFFKSRRCQCLELIAKVCASGGDSRRAKRYIIAAAESLDMIPSRMSLPQKSAIYELTTLMKCQNIVSLGIRTTMNDIFSLSMSSLTFDREVLDVVRALSNNNGLAVCPFVRDKFAAKRAGLDWNREALKYVISIWKKSKVLEDYQQALGVNFLDNVVNQVEILSKFAEPGWTDFSVSSANCDTMQAFKRLENNVVKNRDASFSATICDAALTFVKKVLNETGADRNRSLDLLIVVAEESCASSTCRAEALYLIAIDYLEKGRQSGELKMLWTTNSSMEKGLYAAEIDNAVPHLRRARGYLLQAVSFIGPASSLLSRNVLRTLALVTGSEELNAECGISAGELIHSSIGSSARQAVARGLDPENPSDNRHRTIFEALDHPFSKKNERKEMLETMYEMGHACIPRTWKFVAMTLCPTGEVLISLVQPSSGENGSRHFAYQSQCIFPQKPNRLSEINEFEETVLQPFDNIMKRSRQQISGIDLGVANNNYNNCKEKKQAWWNERYKLDEELCQLLEQVDERYFESSNLGDLISRGDEDEDDTCVGNLSARFEAVCNIYKKESVTREDTIPSKEELNKITVLKLKEWLIYSECSPKDFHSLGKAGLIDLLHNTLLTKPSPVKMSSTYSKGSSGENCIFLLLDEQLQRLPLEGVKSLLDKTVCRLPSLPFAISSLHRGNSNKDISLPAIDCSKSKYVIDPESNLKETQERMLSALTSISEDYKWNWEGKVGEAPSKDFMHRALKEKEGLYLYFGHGGGELFFSRVDIEELANNSTFLNPFASVILMGCSSGGLISPNCQKGNSVSGDQMHFEPDGTALSYLCAGAPCVVGNLWDVTDRDIDRYSVSLLEGIYQAKEPTNLAKCAMSSRGACKLKYIVGSAPVVYGIPVSIRTCAK